MKIVYVSSLVSEEKMNYIIDNSKEKPLQSIQRYHRLICEGLAENNCEANTISAIPVSSKISNKKIWFEKSEKCNKVKYQYIPFINIKILRQLFLMFFTILMLCKEIFVSKKEVIVICDVLNTTISSITLLLCKLFGIKCVAIVTDLPTDMKQSTKLSIRINSFIICYYDYYILISEYMNNILNKKNKPYIVIEGICELAKTKELNIDEPYIMYAGGLYERYGIKYLIDGFLKLNDKNMKLYLFGNGDLETYIKRIDSPNIKYFGTKKNEEILAYEKQAVLLVNPRFSNEEYTKYSFPSKNIEYMSSGTPVLTTKLPGIPKEYNEYVYFIEEENTDGIFSCLNEIFLRTKEELNSFGKKAKEFVLKQKSKNIQAKKIIDLTSKNIENIRKNMNKNYGVFVLIVTMLLSRNTLISSDIIGFYISFGIICLIYIPLIFNFFKEKQYKKNNFLLMAILLSIIISLLLKVDFQFYNFSIILYILLSYIYVCNYKFKDILKWFCYIMFFLCLYSLITTYFIYPLIKSIFGISNLSNSIFYFENIELIPFFNMLFSYQVILPGYIRNFGVFTEPGFYQYYILLSILIVLFSDLFKSKKIKYTLLLVFIISLFSTFSTAGYICGVILICYLLYVFYNIKKGEITKKQKYIFIISLIIFVVLFILYIYFVRNSFTDTVMATFSKLIRLNASSSTRLYSLFYTFKLLLSSIVFGNDLSLVLDNGIIITNTNVTFMAIYGILSGFLLIILQYRFCEKISKKDKIIIFILLLLSVNNHLFIGVHSFWVLMLSGLEE